jgi:citrate synthase
MSDGPKIRTVGELMSSPAVTARPSELIRDASERMRVAGVGSVVVIDGDERPIGILTERDLISFAASGSDSSATKVSEWMTESPATVGPDEPVHKAFAELAERGYRHFPVVTDGRLVGVVSQRDMLRIARIEPVTSPGTLEAPKGLAGVIVAETEVGDVRGLEGFYHYRQYSAVELTEKRPLEDAWYLLFEGALPTDEQRAAFVEEVRPLREIPERVRPLLGDIAQAGDTFVPLAGLRTAMSLVGQAAGMQSFLDIPHEQLRADALRVCAVTPTLVAALWRLRQGEAVVEPHPELGYAANYLYMISGEVPDPDIARAIEQYQMTTIDHGFNASTFAGRVITSTGADLCAAVVGAIGALSGPLHGGAPSRALDMLDAIGEPANTRDWVRNAMESGDRIMGFGHRVYKTEDPRSRMLKGVARRLGGDTAEFALEVERVVVETLAELKPGRELYANVEFYAGVVMDRCGMPREMFTPTFASSRVIGWCANILEQAADNRIIRPSARYVGPPPPQPVPELDA